MTSAAPSTDEGYGLRYGAAATAAVKSSLHLALRPHLQDVRAMLRLPLPEAGITTGCNFAAVHVLLNVLSGLSRLMGSCGTYIIVKAPTGSRSFTRHCGEGIASISLTENSLNRGVPTPIPFVLQPGPSVDISAN
jgi:hypothetical protein